MQARSLMDQNIAATHLAGAEQKRSMRYPLLSSLLDDCLEEKTDLVFGSARYNLPGIAIFGPSNAVDGLLAIQELVFGEKALSLAEFRDALKDDYAGHEDLRERVQRRSGRFGNGREETDSFANRVHGIHSDYAGKQAGPRGGRYACGVWPVESHVHAGRCTGAGPDGRLSGAPLVDGVGACHGADVNGPTALLRSVAGLDSCRNWPAGNTFNIRLSGDGLAPMMSLVDTFMELGGQQIQINVVDTRVLLEAQRVPELHGNLLVRVAGFSAYFTMLSKAVQDEIISRTEHKL